MRVVLVAAVVALLVACLAGMRRGYRTRARRQAAVLPAFAPVPARPGQELLAPATGVYVSTTTAASWQDRVAVGDLGFRARATLHLHERGVLFDRTGASPLWIDRADVRGARTAPALAGKVMGGAGLLVLRWQHGDHWLDTGFRADDRTGYQRWIDALEGSTP